VPAQCEPMPVVKGMRSNTFSKGQDITNMTNMSIPYTFTP